MKRYIKWGILLVIVCGIGLGVYINKEKKAESANSVKLVTVKKGDLYISLSSNGNVAPKNRVEIKPPISGRIERIIVEEGDYVQKGQTLAWMSSTERAALLDSVRNQGSAEMAKWQELYKPIPIVAPVSGTIIAKNINPGQTVNSADALYVLSDNLIIKVQVDESDIAKIFAGQKAKVVLDAHSEKPFKGRVDKIALEAQTVNNVTIYTVDVLPVSAVPFMRSGMSCSVTFEIETKNDVLLIPTTAIISKRGKTFVKQGEKMVAIQTGSSDGRYTEVTSGLSEGDEISVAQLKRKTGQQSSNPFAPNNRQNNSGNQRRQQ